MTTGHGWETVTVWEGREGAFLPFRNSFLLKYFWCFGGNYEADWFDFSAENYDPPSLSQESFPRWRMPNFQSLSCRSNMDWPPPSKKSSQSIDNISGYLAHHETIIVMDKNDKEQLLKNTCLLIVILGVISGHWCEGSEGWVQPERRCNFWWMQSMNFDAINKWHKLCHC